VVGGELAGGGLAAVVGGTVVGGAVSGGEVVTGTARVCADVRAASGPEVSHEARSADASTTTAPRGARLKHLEERKPAKT
jgi:hypothetical protein